MPSTDVARGPLRSVDDERRARHQAKLIMLSYRYSQGGIGTQNRMLRFIEEHFHPDLFRGPLLPRTRELTREAVAAVFLNEAAHPATAVPWDHPSPGVFRKSQELVVNELADLFGRFANPTSTAGYGTAPAALCESILVMDADYLRRAGGRAGSNDTLLVRVGPYRRDPWESVFVRHCVLRRTTRTSEFDELFSRLAAPTVLQRLDRDGAQMLRFVIEVYRQRHPDLQDRRLANLDELARAL